MTPLILDTRADFAAELGNARLKKWLSADRLVIVQIIVIASLHLSSMTMSGYIGKVINILINRLHAC